MIGLLRGCVMQVDQDYLLLDVGGVGFQIRAFPALVHALPPLGEEISLFTHLHVREDALELFGFRDQEQLKLFQLLLKVSGIGPSLALAIISTLGTREIRQALEQGDVDALCRVSGVGKKTAQRLVFELKGSLPEEEGATDHVQLQEVYQALESLGYRRKEVQPYVEQSLEMLGDESTVSQLLKHCLKSIAEERG